jgi:hypothetical protein
VSESSEGQEATGEQNVPQPSREEKKKIAREREVKGIGLYRSP